MRIWIVNEYANPPSKPGGGRHHGLASELNRLGHSVTIVRSDWDHLTGGPDGNQAPVSRETHDSVDYIIIHVGRFIGSAFLVAPVVGLEHVVFPAFAF